MASIRKHRDKWQAQIRLRGVSPQTKSFTKKADALSWARITESEIERGIFKNCKLAEQTIVAELLDRYLECPLLSDANSRSSRSRCKPLRTHLGRFTLRTLSSQHLAQYRDQRLEVASDMTVIHELNLLHRVLVLATSEWGIALLEDIPTVRLPKRPTGRVRRLNPNEENALHRAMVEHPNLEDIVNIAIETGMRRGELVTIKWADIDFTKSTLNIPETKTDVPREIPLSSKATQILKTRSETSADRYVFPMDAGVVTREFTSACRRASIENLRFHDLRHEAISRFFEQGLNVIEVASISGHRTLDMLNRYTHPRAEDLAVKLNA